MKKLLWGLSIGAVILIIGAFLLGRFAFPNTLKDLPVPELSEGQRGELGIDKNVNESTIDEYLNRSDAVYRDLRMLKDPGNYEAIGGDSYLSGFVNGFSVVPFPYIVNVTGLPEAVGGTYAGPTLFRHHSDGSYTENYAESMDIIEGLFPKDKVIFLMCGGGGYSGMMKNMLVALGWDESKIYDVGGYWFYEGDNAVEVKRVLDNGETVYDFYKVPYHEIDFEGLTEK
jgi:rhodanese-related sulfurtransferase